MPITGKKITIPAKEYDKYWVHESRIAAPLGESPQGSAILIPYREVDGEKEAAPQEMWIQVTAQDIFALAEQHEDVAIAMDKTLKSWEIIAKEQNKI